MLSLYGIVGFTREHSSMERKIYLLILSVLAFATAQAQKNAYICQFTFSGKVVGEDAGVIYISYLNKDGQYIRDSCTLKKGAFRFQGSICESTHAYFWGSIKSRNVDDPNFTDIFLEPNTMHGAFRVNNFKEGTIEGSKTQHEYRK